MKGAGKDAPGKSWFFRLAKAFDLKAPPANAPELRRMLSQAAEQGVLDQKILPLLEGVLSVRDMRVKEIMMPLSQVVCISIRADIHELLSQVIESGHSRFPVVGEAEDDIRGILHAKDLLPLALNGGQSDFNIRHKIRPAYRVPETMQLDSLLQVFRATHNHMAVVIDEYAKMVGVTTIEDVLEQIVGEIADEYDTDEDDSIKPLDACNFIVKSTASIGEFNEFFKTECASAEHETIGGVVLHSFGRMPKRGESIELENMKVSVLRADSRRLHLLQITLGKPLADSVESTHLSSND